MRMAGDARRYPRSVAAAGREKDRLDLVTQAVVDSMADQRSKIMGYATPR